MDLARRRRLVLALAAVVVLAVAAFLVVRATTGDDAPQVTGSRSIPVSGGVRLAADVVPAQHVTSGTRPALVVMPAGWGVPVPTYRLLARHLAAAGYSVVVYSQRGQPGSTGLIDMAGRTTQADAEQVIDWSLAHLHVDPARIGMWGGSYGAGVSLMTAAHDRRVRAVVALSTWVDSADVLTPGGTVATQTLDGLLQGARVDPAVARLRAAVGTDPQAVPPMIAALSKVSSPIDDVRDLNRNGTAIMIDNAFEDHIFGPRRLADFYDALTTPKRLELSGGDHGTVGYAAVLGQPDSITDRGVAWLDRWVRGEHTDAAPADQVALTDVVTGAWRVSRSWPATTSADRFALAAPGSGVAAAPATWTDRLTAGTDTAATSGTGNGYPPVRADLRSLPARYAARWDAPSATHAVHVTGTPWLHLRVGSSGTSATVFTYLYDVGPDGQATLMTFAPATVTGLTPGSARGVTVDLQPIAWTVATGHHLAFVVDTVDPRYASADRTGGTVTLSSVATDPAVAAVPVG